MNARTNFKQLLLKLALILMFALASVCINSYAASVSAHGTATVVADIGVTKSADLRFGKFSAGTGGTVVIGTASTRTKTGAVILSLLDSGPASFAVAGDTTATYSITLPTTGTVTHTDNTASMSVGAFVSNPSGSGTLTAGAQTLLVGGTLTVASAQRAGAYSGSFSVTVDYN